jgi:uncharacterized protein DUF4190
VTDPVPEQNPPVPPDPRQSGNPWYPQAPPYPHWQYVPYPTTNGFAIAALTCSFFGILGGILGIIFGCVALNQTRQRRQRGRGMATAGVIIGSCWVILLVIGIIVASVTST